MIAADMHSAQQCEEAELLAAVVRRFLSENPDVETMVAHMPTMPAVAFVNVLERALLSGMTFKLNNYHRSKLQ